MVDFLADFKQLLVSHTNVVNREREVLARRVANVVAASGSKPLQPVDVTVAMARIDTIFDEYYGLNEGDEEAIFRQMAVNEANRAEQLAKDQSNAIIREELKDDPELIPLVEIP